MPGSTTITAGPSMISVTVPATCSWPAASRTYPSWTTWTCAVVALSEKSGSGMDADPIAAVALLAGLGRRLQLLLVRPDLGQRVVVDDVGDRDEGALVAVGPRRLAPAGRPDAELLAEQRHGDLRLVGAEARQLGEVIAQLLPGGGSGPHPLGVAVVTVGQQPGEFLHAAGHRPREPVQRGPLREDVRERAGVVVGQLLGGWLVPQAQHQLIRRAEGLLQRDLLVQQHRDQQGQRAAGEQLVGLGVDRQRQRHGSLRGPGTHHPTSPPRARNYRPGRSGAVSEGGGGTLRSARSFLSVADVWLSWHDTSRRAAQVLRGGSPDMSPHMKYGIAGVIIGLILFIVSPWLALGVIALAVIVPAVAYAMLDPSQRRRLRQNRRRKSLGS